MTLGDLLAEAAARAPALDAVVFPDERLDFAALAARAGELARGLIGLGVAPGDRVGILLANSPDGAVLLFACALAGAVAVPVNTRYRAVELPFVIADAGLRIVVTSDRIDEHVDLAGLLHEALPGLADAPDPAALELAGAPELRCVVALGATPRAGLLGEDDLTARAVAVAGDDLARRGAGGALGDDALLLYTSGTTASPRGCRISHDAIVRNWTMVAGVLGLGEGDRLWAPCPLFHLAAIGPLVSCVRTRAAFVSDTWFEPRRALDLVVAQRATHLYPAYPPITQRLLAQEGFDAASLTAAQVIVNVGPPDLLRQMQAALPGVVQLSLYGSTEGGGAITYGALDEDLETRITTCGRPLPGTEVRIAQPGTDAPLPAGQEGEIQVRSPVLFGGYANDEAKTAAAFHAEGWYRTGDRGALDDAGRLRFLGRLKDMLKVGGENVAPAELESLLATHPAVKLVRVVGVPDPRLEEVPAAFVELRPGAQATPEELIAFCRERIARFKVPRHVRLVTSWPMSATKIQKGPLRDGLVAELGPAP
ncbi:AMP-binding protein [Baekduia soli]|uniref:AMP-binding protein n=1 Tax=Baekduia soli TaxID=496014 RepID=A0A5B8UBU5_9ACTN|nr:AMP-binding protein [Baekduia soli]QEC50510.1 AMP-binding protein [Baekduia soli]